jgi:hypothetical protein
MDLNVFPGMLSNVSYGNVYSIKGEFVKIGFLKFETYLF